MKKVIILPLLICLALIVHAQAPQKFSYQAIARNAAGDPLENQAIGVRMSILNNTATGTLLYRETHTTTTNQFGLFTVEVGGGTVVNGNFSAINWNNGDKYLRVDFDPNGGTSYTNMGANQLLSVPYALSSKGFALPFAGTDSMNIADRQSFAITQKNSSTDTNNAKAAIQGLLNTQGAGFGVVGTLTGNAKNSAAVSGQDFSSFHPNNSGVYAVSNNNNGLVASGGNHGAVIRNLSSTAPALHVKPIVSGRAAYFENGTVGIGVLAPAELLDVSGAIKLGNTGSTNPGAIRFTGSDFEGNIGGFWTSLTSGTGGPSFWTQSGDSMTTTNPNARIALGSSSAFADIYVRRPAPAMEFVATSPSGLAKISLANFQSSPLDIAKMGGALSTIYGRPVTNAAVLSNNSNNMMLYSQDSLFIGTNSNFHSVVAPNGNMGVGTINPGARLEVAGQVKITGGSPGAGKVLTSNAQGLATWQNPATYTAGAGISIAGNVVTNTAPDQTVTLTGAGATSVTGTYPNFTITSTDNNTTYTAGTGLNLAGTVFSAQNTTALWNANQLQGRAVASTLPANGDVLTYNGTNWVPQAPSGGGGGGSQWTTSGSDIYNNNLGSVLVGATTPSSANGIFEVSKNTPFSTAASIYNSGASYMTVLRVADNGTSGNPSGCVGCTGNAAIKASSAYGDALFASSSNGRGIYLSGGSAFSPAMLVEVNPGATTALELAGQIKITAGSPGAGKVLTSDASGLATWQTPSGGGGASGWNFDGTNAFNTTFATGGKISIGTNNPFPNYSLTVTGNTNNAHAAYFSAFNASSNALVTGTGNVGIGTNTPGAKLEVNGQVKITGGSPGAGKVLTSDANGLATWETPSGGGGGGSNWALTGNSGTTSSNFIGTTDLQPIRFRTNNVFAGEINPNNTKLGAVSIGLNSNTLGSQSVAIGSGAGQTTANNGSVMVGVDALKNGTSSSSVAIGIASAINAANFNNSIAIGENSGGSVTDAQYSIFMGSNSGSNSGNSFESIFVGREAGRYTSGDENTFLGTKAGMGYNAASVGQNNTFVGNESFMTFLNGNFNTAIGAQTQTELVYPTIGVTLLGAKSKVNVGSVLAKNNITVIGYEAEGEVDNTVIIGKNADIGIGTSTPTGKTQINATSTVTYPQLLLSDVSTGFSRLSMNNAGSTNRWTIASHADNSNAAAFFNVFYSGTGTNLFSIQGNGNAVLAGTLTQSSDSRLKTNIQPLQNSLSAIMKVNGYSYHWKENLKKDSAKQIGLIAQEVEAIFPEVVSTDENGMKSVAYQNLVPVLIEALKEQQKQIEGLKTQNQGYESKIGALESKMNTIMQALQGNILTETITPKE